MTDAIPDRATPRGMEPDPWHLGDDAVRPLWALGAVLGDLAGLRLATDSSRGGETLDQVRARRGTIALSHQIIDFALHGTAGSPTRRAESETLWSLIDGLFSTGDATPTPLPAGNTHRVTRACASTPERRRRPPPSTSLRRVAHRPAGWVTDASDLTQNQQITALGNEVLALQASCAMDRMLATTPWVRDVP